MIRALTGPDMGVAKLPTCLLVEWVEGDQRVVFSFARQGQGISAHFAAGRESLRAVKPAIEDFLEWVFATYAWCRCVFCMTKRPSIERIVTRLGFLYLTDAEGLKIYVRWKP
jgi:hypothetical protein